jgi:hypothetical protein
MFIIIAKTKANHIPVDPPINLPIKIKKAVRTANKKPVFKAFT